MDAIVTASGIEAHAILELGYAAEALPTMLALVGGFIERDRRSTEGARDWRVVIIVHVRGADGVVARVGRLLAAPNGSVCCGAPLAI